MYLSTLVLVQNFYAVSVLEEIPQNSAFGVRPKPKSSGFEMEANLCFQIKISSLNVLISTNEVSIFKLIIKE